MQTIKILGTGCSKCERTEKVIRQVAEEHHLDVDIQKVEDIQQIMMYNVFSTPVVVVDEEIKIKGRIPSVSEIEILLKA